MASVQCCVARLVTAGTARPTPADSLGLNPYRSGCRRRVSGTIRPRRYGRASFHDAKWRCAPANGTDTVIIQSAQNGKVCRSKLLRRSFGAIKAGSRKRSSQFSAIPRYRHQPAQGPFRRTRPRRSFRCLRHHRLGRPRPPPDRAVGFSLPRTRPPPQLRRRFELSRVVLVGDRGTLVQGRLIPLRKLDGSDAPS